MPDAFDKLPDPPPQLGVSISDQDDGTHVAIPVGRLMGHAIPVLVIAAVFIGLPVFWGLIMFTGSRPSGEDGGFWLLASVAVLLTIDGVYSLFGREQFLITSETIIWRRTLFGRRIWLRDMRKSVVSGSGAARAARESEFR